MKWFAIAFVALALYLSLAPPQLFGDGSDPIPLCHRHVCK